MTLWAPRCFLILRHRLILFIRCPKLIRFEMRNNGSNQPAERVSLKFEQSSCTSSIQRWPHVTSGFALVRSLLKLYGRLDVKVPAVGICMSRIVWKTQQWLNSLLKKIHVLKSPNTSPVQLRAVGEDLYRTAHATNFIVKSSDQCPITQSFAFHSYPRGPYNKDRVLGDAEYWIHDPYL